MNDIQAMCKRVFVIHGGKGLYDGDFDSLVGKVNPRKKLTFEFNYELEKDNIYRLDSKYDFKVNNSILTAELPEDEMTILISKLFQISTPKSFTVEELPVEETMKAFFASPEKFL
jgi:ABC-2 type transport system ATP-binding protein